jgi:hypothetical protein
MHRFLAKIVMTNLWPQAHQSEITLKKATLLYAIVMRTPICLSKHILHTMLEVRDGKNTSLSFWCLITQICLQVVPDISDSEPLSQNPYPFGIQILMKSNAQLLQEAQGGVPHPPSVLLLCDWPHSVWTKSLVCKNVVLQGISLFRSVSEDSKVRKVGSLSAIRTIVSSRPDAHLSTVPSVWTTWHIVLTPRQT